MCFHIDANHKSNLRLKRLLARATAAATIAATIAATALLAVVTPFTRPVWAQTQGPQPATAPAMAAATIDCNNTPFGRNLILRGEDEVFISSRDSAAPNPGHLMASLFDVVTATGILRDQGLVPDVGLQPATVSAVAATAADLDGDGKLEFVQGFTNASGQYQLLVNKNGAMPQSHTENWLNHAERSMAAGDVQGLRTGSQQIVVASRDGAGALNVAVFPGMTAGTAAGLGSPAAVWQSTANHRAQATQIRVAVGNLDNDRYADIVVALLQPDRVQSGVFTQGQGQLIYLEYQPSAQPGMGTLQERATTTFQINDPRGLKLTLADLYGTAQDVVMVTWDHATANGLSNSLTTLGFTVANINGVTQFSLPSNALVWNTPASARNFAVAAGDVNGDHRDEIVLGYDTSAPNTSNFLNLDLIGMASQNGAGPKLAWLDHWQNGDDGRDQTNKLALAVGDLDRDGRAEIVATFQDASPFGSQTMYLKGGPNQHMQLINWGRQDTAYSETPVLTLGDWNNDAIRAFVTSKCAQTTDADVTAAGFVPPFWANIQGNQDKGGAMGQSNSQANATESSLIYNSASSVSSYVGVGAGFNFFDVFELGVTAKTSSATDFATRDRTTTNNLTTTTTTTGRSWAADALVYKPATYNCYNYQLAISTTVVPRDQAALRFCDYQRLTNAQPLQASELDSWDLDYSTHPEYVPVLRDWASLALFRGGFTDQSSNKASASLAVDSEITHGSFISGTLAQTANDNHAWWQVDLGKSQTIRNIRLWTPPASLSNFYVLVSDTDFRAMPGQADPQNLINRTDVKRYRLADLGNGFAMTNTAAPETTFLTLDAQHRPIRGRYVRVQLAGAGALRLAEVQVFGSNHVEPDQYPLDLCDAGTPKTERNQSWCDVTANDGFYKVMLYNPWHTSDADRFVAVKTRGRVLWDGRINAALNSLSVTQGNVSNDWSMSQETVQTKIQAHTISNNTRNGVSVEAEGAAGLKVLGGYTQENTIGVDSETLQSTAWGNAFNMGGHVTGFPREYSGAENAWVQACRYRFQPYFYETSEMSNLGVTQRFPVLDYLVPQEDAGTDLYRTQDLTACRNGNVISPTPHANSDMVQTVQVTGSQMLMLNVLANDQGNDLSITDVGIAAHGTVTHTTRSIAYTPAQGFAGQDHFTYTMVDAQGVPAEGEVTVMIATANAGAALYLPLISR